ncbi:MAG: immunity 17 family protein [Helicobacteraceae bacterium]|jgi:flagellar biosynthesis protein FlhB|nr:immunity 17 family protein [Helicobacteraceae bacterium]
MEQIKEFLAANPHYFGLLFVIIGVGGLLASIFDWSWIFGDVSGIAYNLKKIDGWVNMFGRKTARILFGILSSFVILGGIVWFVIYAFYYN